MLWHAYTWTRIHSYNNTLRFKPLFWKQILEQFTSLLSGNFGGSQGSRDCLKLFSTRELLLGPPCLSVFPQRLLVVSFLSANACWLLIFFPTGRKSCSEPFHGVVLPLPHELGRQQGAAPYRGRLSRNPQVLPWGLRLHSRPCEVLQSYVWKYCVHSRVIKKYLRRLADFGRNTW